MDEQRPPIPTDPAPVICSAAPAPAPERGDGSSGSTMTDEQSRSSPSTIMSAEDSRKMILKSYEASGVDLPLTQLETVLDKEISPKDFGANKGPRFRKFLDKASSAIITNQRKDKDADAAPDDEWISDSIDEDDNNDNDEKFDDEEFRNKSTGNNKDIADFDTNSAKTPDSNKDNKSRAQMMPVSNYPVDNNKNDTNTAQTKGEEGQIPVTTAANTSVGTTGDMPFAFCCPESSPYPMSNNDDKYVISNLQLPPAEDEFDDEYQNSRRVALMDVEDSMIDTTLTMERSPLSGRNQFSKGGKHGMFTHFRGSRRFRIALGFCCALHLILIGLIITFVMTMGKEDAAITQDQAAISSSTSTSSSINTADMISSTDLAQEQQQMDADSGAETTTSVVTEEEEITSSNMAPDSGAETTTSVVTEEEKITSSNMAPTPTISTVLDQEEVESEETECVDKLELSLDCFGRGSDVLVYFNVCTPQSGDWVALYDISSDPQNLFDDNSVSWLYTCGDRRCTETIQTEVLSFSRVTDVAPAGRYRAYLIRNGEATSFSSFASSPEFRIVDNSNTECPV